MKLRIRFMIKDSEKGLQHAEITATSVRDAINQLFIRLNGEEFIIIDVQQLRR